MSDPRSPLLPSRLALVTCLFDLATREDNTERRTPDFYLKEGEFLFGLNHDIIFFVDREFEEQVLARRRAHGMLSRTFVAATSLEATPGYALANAIREARSHNPVHNANLRKDTPFYVGLTWSKFAMLRQAMTADPFGSTHFAWIDMGITHVARVQHCLVDGVFSRPADKVKLLMLKRFAPDEMIDRRNYYAYIRGHLAGGYISGSKAWLDPLCEVFWREARASLAQGFGPSEEQLLPILVAEHSDLFEFYYGDYDHILENYSRIRGSPKNLLFQMRVCRERRDFRRGCEIGGQLLASHRQGTFEADAEYLSELLDEYFIAAYYLEHPKQGTAREVAGYYVHLTRVDPAFHDVFLRNQNHIRANFSYLQESVSI